VGWYGIVAEVVAKERQVLKHLEDDEGDLVKEEEEGE